MENFLQFFVDYPVLNIFILLIVVAIVLSRLPKIDLGYNPQFKKRRVLNWMTIGFAYAFLYMGRYNLTVSKNAFGDLMTKADFGTIFGVGTFVYGLSFIINGPLTDKWGGRKTILIATIGSATANLLMGLVTYFGFTSNLVLVFSILYGMNMYFQSFGAVSIVKVNSEWFHIRERGTFGGIFGILISLGLYFAYDWGGLVAKNMSLQWVFFVPMLMLVLFTFLCFLFVQDSPEAAGLPKIKTGTEGVADYGIALTALQVGVKMFQDPTIRVIAFVELCSGFLRNAIMNWYIVFAKETGISNTFVPTNWGLLLCCAGIMGGVFAGTISDKLFHSRRGPVAAILYLFMLVGAVLACFTLQSPILGILVIFMSMSIIGVHGMLSGTASMDFGGKNNLGLAVGLIDGMVYLGTGIQSIYYGNVLPKAEAAKDPNNWMAWPVGMIVISAIGFILATRVWNARPQTSK